MPIVGKKIRPHLKNIMCTSKNRAINRNFIKFNSKNPLVTIKIQYDKS